MKEILDQFLQFLQQGIAAIFKFVHLVWAWSTTQITKMMQAPWDAWPLWKQVLLAIIVVAVAYALFIAATRLWVAGVRVLATFVAFLGALVYTLPPILIAGVIALGGMWLINNFNPASLPTIAVFERGNTDSTNRPADRTTGQNRETTGSAR